MNYNCGIMDDLLPLYADGVCSEESKAAMEAHLASCGMCREKLERMQAEAVIPEAMKASDVMAVSYAKKVRKHRARSVVGAAAVSVLAACVLSLCFLTVKDMHDLANPYIYEVEEGTYNLTANDLEVSAAHVENYILYTNNTKIEVTFDENAAYCGEVQLWNADDRTNPVTILYGNITSTDTSCTFTGLSSAHRYMVTCDGDEDMMLTVTDGRHISFWGSMKNVLYQVYCWIIE